MNHAMSRRAMITTGIVGGLASMSLASLPAIAAARRGFFKRHHLPIGVQLYTVADAAQKDLAGSFAKLKAAGIETVELAGYHGHSPAELRAAADRAGLRFTSVHIQPVGRGSGPSLEDDPAKLAAELHTLGIHQGVLPIFPFPANARPEKGEQMGAFLGRLGGLLGADGWKRTAALLNDKAKLLQREGIGLGYHNHNVEFAPVGDTTGWDILLSETDPKLVTFEMDAGWVTAAGRDPIVELKRHPGRFTLMHVKDIKASTVPNFALQQDPTEVGSGMINWKALLPAAYGAGVRHFFIEQEPPFTMDRFDAIAKSRAYLATLG